MEFKFVIYGIIWVALIIVNSYWYIKPESYLKLYLQISNFFGMDLEKIIVKENFLRTSKYQFLALLAFLMGTAIISLIFLFSWKSTINAIPQKF